MGNSLVDLSKLTKPATVLIEKISDATGVLYEPTRIRRKAKAEADASKTKALMDLEIEEIQKRALNRLVTEEIKKQENIENITEKSFSSLNDDAKPENIEDDWLSNFFDKCKLISDNEMQNLWSQILSAEANKPGTFSKRTVEFMSTLDKSDAELFNKFCKFCWYFIDYQSIIINYENDIFKNNGINYSQLQHLTDLGLINFETFGGFEKQVKKVNINNLNIGYYGRILNLNFQNIESVKVGNVSLTKIGVDLLKISHPSVNKTFIQCEEYDDEYYHYIVNEFYKQKIILSGPLENRIYNKF